MSSELPRAGQAPSYWRILADKVQADPALLQIARDNIVRWTEQGHSAPHRLNEWDRLLRAAQEDVEGMRHLLGVLLNPDATSQRLRDFSPFAGVLSREERRRTRELCGFRH